MKNKLLTISGIGIATILPVFSVISCSSNSQQTIEFSPDSLKKLDKLILVSNDETQFKQNNKIITSLNSTEPTRFATEEEVRQESQGWQNFITNDDFQKTLFLMANLNSNRLTKVTSHFGLNLKENTSKLYDIQNVNYVRDTGLISFNLIERINANYEFETTNFKWNYQLENNFRFENLALSYSAYKTNDGKFFEAMNFLLDNQKAKIFLQSSNEICPLYYKTEEALQNIIDQNSSLTPQQKEQAKRDIHSYLNFRYYNELELNHKNIEEIKNIKNIIGCVNGVFTISNQFLPNVSNQDINWFDAKYLLNFQNQEIIFKLPILRSSLSNDFNITWSVFKDQYYIPAKR